jgi:hypothetical protein
MSLPLEGLDMYDLLDSFKHVLEKHTEVEWLRLTVDSQCTSNKITEIFESEKTRLKKLYDITQKLFPGRIADQLSVSQKWKLALKRVLQRKKQGSLEQVVCNANIQSEIPESSFWKNLFSRIESAKHKNQKLFRLDEERVSSDLWHRFHTIEIFGVDFPVIQGITPLFKKVERLIIDNSGLEELKEAVQLQFKDYKNLFFLYLSFDEHLFVHDYKSIVTNYLSNNSKSAKYKVISAPLWSWRVEGNTPIPAAAHPLLFNNMGGEKDLADRTQKILSLIPNAGKNIAIEFFGSNFLTAIDFGEIPVTSSFFESLLQANISTTSDLFATWDARLAWSCKFLELRYLNISGTNIDDLKELRNLKRLETLVLNDNTYSNVWDIRFLPRLKVIRYPLTPDNWCDRVTANIHFVKLSLNNFIKSKHSFFPLLVVTFAVLFVILTATIQTEVQNHLSDC